MQVILGRKGDYSVRAAVDVARHYGQGRRKARHIAATMDIPSRYIPQILAILVRANLLTSVAGPNGGYSLARDPAEITLLDIVVAAEGPVELSACVLSGGSCDWEESCPLHVPWANAQQALSGELRSWTLLALADIDEQMERGTYQLPPGVETHEQPERVGIRKEA